MTASQALLPACPDSLHCHAPAYEKSEARPQSPAPHMLPTSSASSHPLPSPPPFPPLGTPDYLKLRHDSQVSQRRLREQAAALQAANAKVRLAASRAALPMDPHPHAGTAWLSVCTFLFFWGMQLVQELADTKAKAEAEMEVS